MVMRYNLKLFSGELGQHSGGANKNQYRIIASLVALLTINETAMAQTNSVLQKVTFNHIEGWLESDKTDSLVALIRSCIQMKEDDRAFSKKPEFGGTFLDWKEVCALAEKLPKNPNRKIVTQFFQDNFTPLRVNDPKRKQGLFTGYFEPVVKGSLMPAPDYQIPVYRRPDDLVSFTKSEEKQSGLRYGRMVEGKPTSYYTRQQIEKGLFKGKKLELVWLKTPADAFFMQVQGSGRVELSDGTVMRLAYAGKTGLPYTAIGGVLVNNGQLKKKTLSMQTIRQWMEENPDKAQDLMWKNKSFVFFRILKDIDPELGPVGAQHVNLTPKTSLAVDRRYWSLGTPVWLDTKISLDGSAITQPWRALLVAQDTGSAIRGYARGDVFWGSGDEAGVIAGQMKAAGTMVVLLPKKLAARLVD